MTDDFWRWYGGIMRLPNWSIGRALGIPIHVHASWFFVFFFVTWTLATGYLPGVLPGLSSPRYWGMGVVAALLLFLSVLLHELGHSYVAQRYKIPIRQITLFIFGGMAHMGKEPPSPRAEFLIAMAGPIVSLVLGACCIGSVFAAESLLPSSGIQGFLALGVILAQANLTMGLFNLIPGFPLDGGRALRAGLWAWNRNFDLATSQAALVGIGFGLLLGLAGGMLMLGAAVGTIGTGLGTDGGWLMFLGAFLFVAAHGTRRQAAMRVSLTRTAVRQVMVQHVVSIMPGLTVQDAVDQYFVAHGFGGFPVCEEGRVLGMITVDDIQAFPKGLWTWRVVREVMRPATPDLLIPSDWSVMQAMERMTQSGWDRLAVMENEVMVGLITRSAIGHFLRLKNT